MAEQIGYVDTDGTKTYTSLNSAEAAMQALYGNMVGNNDTVIIEVEASAGTADTTAASIGGWTSGASNFLTIRAAAGQEAKKTGYDEALYRLQTTDATPLTVSEEFCRVENIQIKKNFSATNFLGVVHLRGIPAVANDIRIDSCFVTGDNSGISVGIYITDDDIIASIFNTIIVKTHRRGIAVSAAAVVNIYNCVIYNLSRAGSEGLFIDNAGATVTIKNSAIGLCGDDISDTSSASIDYVASDDGDGTNAVAPSGGDWTNEFNDPANDDFTLLTGGNLKNAGVNDPGAGLYSVDMEGDSYNTALGWSIGVDEFISAGTTIVIDLQNTNVDLLVYIKKITKSIAVVSVVANFLSYIQKVTKSQSLEEAESTLLNINLLFKVLQSLQLSQTDMLTYIKTLSISLSLFTSQSNILAINFLIKKIVNLLQNNETLLPYTLLCAKNINLQQTLLSFLNFAGSTTIILLQNTVSSLLNHTLKTEKLIPVNESEVSFLNIVSSNIINLSTQGVEFTILDFNCLFTFLSTLQQIIVSRLSFQAVIDFFNAVLICLEKKADILISCDKHSDIINNVLWRGTECQ